MHRQRGRNGTFILQRDSAKVNGKDFWIKNIGSEADAIWFDKEHKNWKIGDLKDIGTDICAFQSTNNASELHRVTSWKYYNGDEWVLAPTNDMLIRGMYVIFKILDFNYITEIFKIFRST